MDTVMGKPFAYVEGPTCFGGCADFCCDFPFFVSTEQGKSGNLATILKKKPEDCAGCCRACCTTADQYDLTLGNDVKALAPEKKALLMANMVHLDYWLFERDQFPCTCEKQGDTTWITILFCFCYCYGCLIPMKCSIPLQDKNGGGGGD